MEEFKPENTSPIIQTEITKTLDKKWIVIAASTLIGTSLLVGGYLVYQRLTTQSQISDLNSVKIATTDQFADWKTYTNDKYRFEIQYPNDWTFSQQFSYADGFFITKGKASISILPQGEFDHGSVENSKTIQEKLASKNVVTIVVNGGVPIQYQFIDTSIPSTWKRCSDDLKNCNRIELKASSPNDVDIFDQILSTFKFTSSTSLGTSEPIPADWKTYKSDKYGYEFRYPSNWQYKHCDIGDNYLLFNAVCKSDKPSSTNSSVILTEPEGFNTLYNIHKSNTFSQLIKHEKIELDNKSVDLFTKKFVEASGPIKIILFTHNNFLFTITIKESDFDIFDQILSTFKFTKV